MIPFFIVVFVGFLISTTSYGQITYECVRQSDLSVRQADLSEEKQLWIKSFNDAYRNLTPESLGLQPEQSVQAWLQTSAEQALSQINEKIGKLYIVHAREQGKLVGYAVFEPTKNEHEVYLWMLFVDPAYGGCGIGENLVFFIGRLLPETKKLVVMTNKVNHVARSFYLNKCGFNESAYTHEGLSPEHYVAYEWQGDIKKKFKEIDLKTEAKNRPIRLDNVTYEWVAQGDLHDEEEVFVRSFKHAYKNVAPDALGLPLNDSLESFLREKTFGDFKSALKQGRSIYFLRALIDNKVIGFSCFQKTENRNEFFVKALALDPCYSSLEIGEALLFLIGQQFPKTNKLLLAARKLNLTSQNFYTKNGFKEGGSLLENLSRDHYVNYEWQGDIAKKLEEIALKYFASGIEKIIHEIDPPVHLGVEIRSLEEKDEVLFGHNEHYLFIPASTTELMTAALALKVFGPAYIFTTELFTDGVIEKNILKGNLYLKVGGDPSLQELDVTRLFQVLAQKGINEVQGCIYIDRTAFDDDCYAPGVFLDDVAYSWNAPTSACVISRKTLSEESDVRSQFLRQHFYLSSDITSMMKRVGITMSNQVVGFAPCPQGVQLLAAHYSPSLRELTQVMLQESDHLYADCIFKKIGAQICGGVGTWAKGRLAVQEFCEKELNIPAETFVMEDGSGKCRYNLFSPHQLTTLLRHAYFDPAYDCFFDSLAESGTSGSLKNRLRKINGRVWAKSGTLPGVTGLSGYLVTKAGRMVAFSILINGFIQASNMTPVHMKNFKLQGIPYKTVLEDAICEYVATYDFI